MRRVVAAALLLELELLLSGAVVKHCGVGGCLMLLQMRRDCEIRVVR